MRSIESVLEGRELAWRRAARKPDPVPTDGAAVGLVMAGSCTGSGNELGGQQPRPEDEALHLCERPSRRAASLVRGTLEARTAALRAPCEGHLRVAREGHVGDALDFATAPIQTRTVHGERTMCDRSKASSKAGVGLRESAP